MWSIIEISFANEEYVREQRSRQPESIQVLTKREEDLPPSEPLETLAARMRRPGPPAVDLLLQVFRPLPGYPEFLSLIREFLPDSESRIMEQTDFREQMYLFSTTFSDRYFPLCADRLIQDDVEDYEALTDKCPAEFQAFTNYDYDEIPDSDNPALIVLAYILANPWVESDRPPFAEAAAKYLPKHFLERIPEEGFEISDTLDEHLKDTPFALVAFWAKVITQRTENYFFDVSDLEESGAQYEVCWDRPTVEALTRQYQAWEEWQDEWRSFTSWFGKDLVKNAEDFIKILKERRNQEDGTNTYNGDNAEENPWPTNGPRQGRLFNFESYGTPVAGAADPQNPAGRA